jgi:hypothetical protein
MSAAASRQRQKQRVQVLEAQVGCLETENARLQSENDQLRRRLAQLEAAGRVSPTLASAASPAGVTAVGLEASASGSACPLFAPVAAKPVLTPQALPPVDPLRLFNESAELEYCTPFPGMRRLCAVGS